MIKGVVELLTATYLSGWVLEDSTPDQPLEVRVLMDHEEIARAPADLFRQDLRDAGLGAGWHGFRAGFPQSIPAESRERIEVRAIDRACRFKPLPWLDAIKPLRFAGPTQDDESRPVFILGSPRSGTSSMAAALRGATRYQGYDEGHLMALLPQLVEAVGRHYHDAAASLSAWTMLSSIPRSAIEVRLRAIFIELARARFDTPYWIDKTPSNHMIAGAPLLGAIWPHARFIFMKRRAIENIASRMRKFGDAAFEDHCQDWADAMHLWSTVRDALGERAREVDQLTLAREPGMIAATLSPFLDLPPGEAAALAEALAGERTEQTGARVDATAELAETGWTPLQQAAFRRICGFTMRQFGYSEDAAYFG